MKLFASDKPKHEEKSVYFGNSTRYLVLGISTLCLSMTMSNSLAFNFTVICMDHKAVTDDRLEFNSTHDFNTTMLAQEEADYSFSSAQKSWLFSAIAVGTIIGTLPITHLTTYFGIRNTFTAYGLISAFSTLLSPLCAYLGFVPLFAMRVLQGVALSTSYPAMGSIISHWSTLANSGMYIAFLSCHLQLGAIFTMPVAGELCESSFGWPSVYYLQGTLTLLFFLAFYLFSETLLSSIAMSVTKN